MFTVSDIEDYHDHLDKHKDYVLLMEEYRDAEIFKEIIHFMDLAFPEWTSNKGIGFWSAEFVLNSIKNLEHLYEEINYPSFEVLKNLYINLVYDYRNSKASFVSVINNAILDDFSVEYHVLLEENENLPKNDFDAFYNELFKEFKEKCLEKITYGFKEDEFPVVPN